MLNENLSIAKKQKRDEFYTQLPDIERELRHYAKHFEGKVVYCNCDDPSVSQFFHYFAYNFEALKLKKLITTCYKNQERDLFSRHDCEQAIYLEYTGDRNQNKVPDPEEIGVCSLKGDGDFRSDECIELLKLADIVVTNPPFSLFREYVAQLMEHKKQFVIIGNKNAITYKEIFSLIKDNKMWVGNTSMSKDMLFDVSEDFAEALIATKKEGSGYRVVDGLVKARAQAIWFTNLDIEKRNSALILTQSYDPSVYPKYDNYDAIEVSQTKNIPKDYAGVMGVQITFLDKYKPDQFEILGMDRPLVKELLGKVSRFHLNGKEVFARIIIRNRKPE